MSLSLLIFYVFSHNFEEYLSLSFIYNDIFYGVDNNSISNRSNKD